MNQLFQVSGMSCGHCVRAVTDEIRRLDPSAQVEVDLEGGSVQVDSERERADIARAIREAGYEIVA
jgi:copper chaperone